jgi:hypothetical protein
VFHSPGEKNLFAAYAGDGNFLPGGSPVLSRQVDKAGVIVVILSDSPDPSVIGEDTQVLFSVTPAAPGAGLPAGNVTVSDGTESCTGTVAAGQCTLVYHSPGEKRLIASYNGDDNFTAGASPSETHLVNRIDTLAAITGASPAASVVGQPVTVYFSLTPASAGAPTGLVTIRSGSDSCTAGAAAGQCTLLLTSPGVKSLVASYAGDDEFYPHSSAPFAYAVQKAGTLVEILGAAPAPSGVGRAVTVQFKVEAATPGGGIPSGIVTISDGKDECIALVAAGECSLALTTLGTRDITAAYSGDDNFNSSVSAPAAHEVTRNAVQVSLEVLGIQPVGLGQQVNVRFSVSPPDRVGTPAGSVTISDGEVSCTATVASGECRLAFTSLGTRTLTASYSGDEAFSPAISAGKTVQVVILWFFPIFMGAPG